MATVSVRHERPDTREEAAALLAACAADGGVARIAGAATKAWGSPGAPADLELSTLGMARIVEHNEGDFTAVLEAGVALSAAQERFAAAGQKLMLDPPLGASGGATIGGVVSAGDSGPLRHRYGGPRDLVLGTRVALSDGTLARSGGKVIKNVAGYDLAKLVTGALGTLGVLCEVAVRLHPLPKSTATLVARVSDAAALARTAAALSHARIETDALDVRWVAGEGAVLGRYAGAAAGDLAESARVVAEGVGADASVVEDDEALWAAQRNAQRAADGAAGAAGAVDSSTRSQAHPQATGAGAIVRVSGRPSGLERVVAAADAAGASLVGRAALGLTWIALPPAPDGDVAAAVAELRRALAPFPCALLDAREGVRGALDPWDGPDGAELELMRRVKDRFDPTHTCNRGIFVGGL